MTFTKVMVYRLITQIKIPPGLRTNRHRRGIEKQDQYESYAGFMFKSYDRRSASRHKAIEHTDTRSRFRERHVALPQA
jgi:hypothetical protein